MAQAELTRGLDADAARRPPAAIGEAALSAASPRWEGLLPWQARRVRDYVDGGLDGRPSIRGAAEQARLSPSYFSRRFRQSYGVTFSRFVAHRRIERAQSMMVGSSSSLCQIALACGFTDQAHFTRTFGGLIGATPSQWRRIAVRPGDEINAIAYG
ncbi:helix-turn-helix transcriptional regulator [Caulobacter hibisci]|uniref:Helix-turn-helix transcriptional regulator n=1 Tax=Caulobacter hibisci TaxID=2035993 RepID=A0ABS0T3Y3_9CAUL|nr:AraC family transcriptional regulator [Caulobacter hibisci]MBI1685603.1 helix-turn-helix transcriptional regulator [Caulobacter hibisci]